MKAEDGPFYDKSMLKSIESFNRNQRTMFFSNDPSQEKCGTDCDCSRAQTDEQPTLPRIPPYYVEADCLRDFPLRDPRRSLHGLPTDISIDGAASITLESWLIGYNGDDNITVYALSSVANTEWYRYVLPIPSNMEVLTVADMSQLSKLRLLKQQQRDTDTEWDVVVTVEDNKFIIASIDGKLKIEVQNLMCSSCNIPCWKFPLPPEGWISKDLFGNNADERDNPKVYTTAFGGGQPFKCYVNSGDSQKLCCFECAERWKSCFLEANPLAKLSSSLAVARDTLNRAGFPDVELNDFWVEQISEGDCDGWEFHPFVTLTREGSTVTRFAGTISVLNDGRVNSNLYPAEFIRRGLPPPSALASLS